MLSMLQRIVQSLCGIAPVCAAVIALLATPVRGAQPVNLTFTFWGTPEQATVIYAAVDAFHKENPDIHVDATLVPGDYTGKLLTMFAGGSAPDVGWIEITPFPAFAAKGFFENLDPYVKKSRTIQQADYFPRAWKAFTYQGTVLAITRDLSPLVTYYNVELFDEVGVAHPSARWTWDEYVAIGKKFAIDENGDGRQDRWGSGGYHWPSAVWQSGGDIFDSEENPREVKLRRPETMRGLSWIAGLVSLNVVPGPGAITGDYWQNWINGKVAMHSLVGRWMVPSARQQAKFTWDVVPMPAGPGGKGTLHGGTGYWISTTTKHKAEAWRFIEFMAGPKGQMIDMSLGRSVPTHRVPARSPQFLNSIPPKNNLAFIESTEFARRIVMLPENQDVDRLLGNLNQALQGREALSAAVERTALLLEEFVKSRANS